MSRKKLIFCKKNKFSKLFEKIDVLVSENPGKNSLFTADERVLMLKTLTEPYHNVEVHKWDRLVVEYARKIDAKVLIRGIRNVNDFSYEFDLSLVNHNLNPEIEIEGILLTMKEHVLKI